MYKTVKTQINLPVKICHLKVDMIDTTSLERLLCDDTPPTHIDEIQALQSRLSKVVTYVTSSELYTTYC